jgi:pimeloyl-ACP methyl ester carboxylesterase
MVKRAEILMGHMPAALFVRIVFGYARVARFRYRHAPEVLATIDEFIARRTEADRRAGQRRLHLVGRNDPRPVARQTSLPVFGLSGVLDPIVPWFLVRPWLRKHCPALRDYQVIRGADHNVLSTAPGKSAALILKWIG